jgi:pyruvate,water dikinase
VTPIIEKTRGAKATKVVYATRRSGTRVVRTSEEERRRLVLSDAEILSLARWAVAIESHYKRPMDMEWAKDGRTSELFLIQARPETVHARKQVHSRPIR